MLVSGLLMVPKPQPSGPSGPPGVHLVFFDGHSGTVLRETVGRLQKHSPEGVVLTANRTATTLSTSLSRDGVAVDNLHFVDCISGLAGVRASSHEKTLYVDSPSLLEKMALRVDQAMRRGAGFLVVDCLSTLAVHNGAPAVVEWTHGIVERARRLGVPVALLMASKHAEMADELRLLCDETPAADWDAT